MRQAAVLSYGQTVPAHWDIHTVSCPSEVRTRIMTVDDYDAVAANFLGLETIRGSILPYGYQAGDPGGGSIAQSIDISSSASHGVTWGVELEMTTKIAVGGVKGGITAGTSYEGGCAWISTSGSSFTGEVSNMPRGASGAYSFDWRFFYHTAKLNGEDCLVLEYLTRNVSK